MRRRADPSQVNLSTLIQYYNMYTNEHDGTVPPDEGAFKAFLAEKKVPDADKLLISPRDKQPYKIKYGVAPVTPTSKTSKGLVPPDKSDNQAIIAEEQTGVGGKRMIIYNSGVIKEAP